MIEPSEGRTSDDAATSGPAHPTRSTPAWPWVRSSPGSPCSPRRPVGPERLPRRGGLGRARPRRPDRGSDRAACSGAGPAAALGRAESSPEAVVHIEEGSAGRRHSWRRVGAAAALACFCTAGTMWSLGAHAHPLRSGPVPALVARRAAGVFTVTVTGDPRAVVSTISFAAPRVSVDATLTSLRSGVTRVPPARPRGGARRGEHLVGPGARSATQPGRTARRASAGRVPVRIALSSRAADVDRSGAVVAARSGDDPS